MQSIQMLNTFIFLLLYFKYFLLAFSYLFAFYCAPSQIEKISFFFAGNVQMPCVELNELNASNAFFWEN